MKLDKYLEKYYGDRQVGATASQFCRDFGITHSGLRAYLRPKNYEVVTTKDGRKLLVKVFNDCETIELEDDFIIAKIVGECK